MLVIFIFYSYHDEKNIFTEKRNLIFICLNLVYLGRIDFLLDKQTNWFLRIFTWSDFVGNGTDLLF